MSSDTIHRNPALHPVFLLASVALHVAVFIGWKWYASRNPATPAPPIMEIMEVAMFEMASEGNVTAQGSIPAETQPPKETVEPPKETVEPPKETVEPPMETVEPPKETVEPPKVAEREEPPPPPKKTLAERLASAPITDNPPPPPQNPPREQPRQRTDEIARSIQNRVNQTASSLKAHVSSTPSSSVAGVVSAAQMSRYQAYMANSVTPKIRMLWNQHGPSGLDTIPRPAVITFYVEPSGRVNSYFISVKSDSAVVNQGAEALGKALTSQGLPPFSAANLVTEQNRPLTIQFTLDYQP